MTPTLSVVIPCLNEAENLPRLLAALNEQTQLPLEVIVADAGSTDGTQALARQHDAQVVPGGMPGPGRNAGARVAQGDVLLFLDADVLPKQDFVAGALAEFAEHNYVAAGCLIEALDGDAGQSVLVEASNLFLQVVQYISPHAHGFCIMARREVHEAIGGFDEDIKIAEDHEYVQRAAKHGEFGVITRVRIPVSLRRLETEGLTRLALKYMWCEMYALAGKPIYATPFEYAFDAHGKSDDRPLIDVGALRERLGKFEDPMLRLSEAGREALRSLAESDLVSGAAEHLRLALARPDADILHEYMGRRADEMKRSGRPKRKAPDDVQEPQVAESIRWPYSRASRKTESEMDTVPATEKT